VAGPAPRPSTSPARAEDLVEPVDVEVGALRGDAQWRLDLEHVGVVAGGVLDDAELEQPFADGRRLGCCRLLRLRIPDELDPLVEATAVDTADDRVPRGERTQTLSPNPRLEGPDVVSVGLTGSVGGFVWSGQVGPAG
jgi:hypothetical protein